MLIRDFAPGDEPHLAQLYYDAVHQTAAADYSPEQLAVWAPADRDPTQWAERLRRIRPFLAEIDGVIVGYADVQSDGYIDHFYVLPGAGRRGIGSALMNQIQAVAWTNQTRRLYANVSLTARFFFEKFDFLVDKEQVVVVSGIPLRNFRMSKSLVPR